MDTRRFRTMLSGATARALGLRLIAASGDAPVGVLKITVDERQALVFAGVSDDPGAPAVVLANDWWTWVRPLIGLPRSW